MVRDGIRVLVCGARDWKNQRLVESVLDGLNESRGVDSVGFYHPYSGAIAPVGAARHGEIWAQANGLTRIAVGDYFKEAKGKDFSGPFKDYMWHNEVTLDMVRPHVLVAFHDYIEKSQLTADLLNRAAWRSDVLGRAKLPELMIEVRHYTQFMHGEFAHWMVLTPPVAEK